MKNLLKAETRYKKTLSRTMMMAENNEDLLSNIEYCKPTIERNGNIKIYSDGLCLNNLEIKYILLNADRVSFETKQIVCWTTHIVVTIWFDIK